MKHILLKIKGFTSYLNPKAISRKLKIRIIAVSVFLSSLIFVGFSGDNFEIVKNLDIYYSMFRELNLFYVDEIDPGEVIKTSMDKMLESLDPYTVFIPESKIEDFRVMTTGQYGGVGATFKIISDFPVVSEVYEDSPASRSNLKPGDIILEINRIQLKGRSLIEVNELLNGQPNTKLSLQVRRAGSQLPEEMLITREEIKLKSVPLAMMLDDNTGYIKLNSFTQTASKEIKEAFLKLRDKENAKSIVLDLRGNPGGLVQEAVEILNFFIDKDQEVLSTRGKVKEFDKVYKTTKQALDGNIPLVILVNSGSASASEIISGSMQDLDRGVVIGERTFGKGLVQAVRDLSYNSKLKLTTAKYYIPSGRCIQALDYSHRKADGSVGKVPDSLVSVFSTSAGRKVYDGGGIMPDIYIKPTANSRIAQSLLDANIIFDYASRYVNQHSSVESPEKFVFSQSDYTDFMQFAKTQDFSYESKTSDLLKKLKEAATSEKYIQAISSEFSALEKKLSMDKSKDMGVFREEISELISQEIMSRYFYAQGRLKYSFRDDPALKKAIQLLNNPAEYQKILRSDYQIPKNPPED